MYRNNHTSYRPLSRACVAFFLLIVGLAGCGPKEESPTASSAKSYPIGTAIEDSAYAMIIVAGVASDTLTSDFFMTQLLSYEQQVMQQRPGSLLDDTQRRQVRKGIAEEYIRRRLLMTEAERLSLTADPAEIEAGIDRIIQQNRMESREVLEQVMATQGMTMDSLRTFLADEVLLQMVTEQMVESAGDPTEAEIVAYSQELGEEVWAQHILFSEGDEATLAKANAVLDSAKAGTDFFELARRHSEGPSAPNGGDLGYFKKNAMVPPFSEAAFALADSGDVAPELVQTQFGYHIIRMLGRRVGEPVDTTRARAMLTQNRQREAYEKRYDELREAVVVRINPQIIDAEIDG